MRKRKFSNYDELMKFYGLFLSKNNVISVLGKGVYGCSELYEGNARGFIGGVFTWDYCIADFTLKLQRSNLIFDEIEFDVNRLTKGFFPARYNVMRAVGDEEAQMIWSGGEYEYSFLTLEFILLPPHSAERYRYCEKRRKAVCDALQMIGFPEPIKVKTGYGCAAFFPVSRFRNNSECVEDIKIFLRVLEQRYSTDSVHVGTNVFQANTMIPLPGTRGRQLNVRKLGFEKLPDDILGGLTYKTFRQRIMILQSGLDSKYLY